MSCPVGVESQGTFRTDAQTLRSDVRQSNKVYKADCDVVQRERETHM
jgi:hypothetical protein